MIRSLVVNIAYHPWWERSTDRQTVWKAFALPKDFAQERALPAKDIAHI